MLCKKCNKKEKIGYKYCAECKIVANKESDERSRKKNRAKLLAPCTLCNKKLTSTKYCNACSQKAKREKDRIRTRTWNQKQKQLKETAEGQRLKAKENLEKKINRVSSIHPRFLSRQYKEE